jgi:HEAT repeat protein
MSAAYKRFMDSMVLGFDAWHDGTGYDLAALRDLTPDERKSVEATLKAKGPDDWRAVEALAALGTDSSLDSVRQNLDADDPVVRITAIRELFDKGEITDLTPHLERLLAEHADNGSAFTQTMDMVWWHNVKGVTPRLLEIAARGEGTHAANAAAMVLFLHDLAKSPFDWGQRPFFLRFNTTDEADRRTAYEELCAKIGVTP